MPTLDRSFLCLGLRALSLSGMLLAAAVAVAQPGTWRLAPDWARLPDGLQWGPVVALEFDRDGNLYVLHRCGAETCVGRSDPPILKFDPSGALIDSWGSNLFVWPHGMHIDAQGSIWVSDGRGADGQGHQVLKFSPSGDLLLRLGQPGVAGDDAQTLNGPTDIAVAANGDIFVADGHGNSRVVKFSADGEYLLAWGRRGAGPGEFEIPHAIAIDARGRILVADRDNNRIQVFDQNGGFLEAWSHFDSPSGFYMVDGETLYVAYSRGVHIARAADGVITETIDHSALLAEAGNVEDVAADADGNVYAGLAGPWTLQRIDRP